MNCFGCLCVFLVEFSIYMYNLQHIFFECILKVGEFQGQSYPRRFLRFTFRKLRMKSENRVCFECPNRRGKRPAAMIT